MKDRYDELLDEIQEAVDNLNDDGNMSLKDFEEVNRLLDELKQAHGKDIGRAEYLASKIKELLTNDNMFKSFPVFIINKKISAIFFVVRNNSFEN